MGREFTSPEAISWHISDILLDGWNNGGVVLGKAHRIKEFKVGDRAIHRPVCGAQIAHWDTHCQIAPGGWPKCLKCAKKTNLEPIPEVFEEAFRE